MEELKLRNKNILFLMPVILTMEAALAVCTVVSAFFDYRLFIVQLVITAAVTVFVVRSFSKKEKQLYKSLAAAGTLLSASDRTALKAFTIPIVMTADTGEILWYNDLFRSSVIENEDEIGKNIRSIIGQDTGKFFSLNNEWVSYRQKEYRVYGAEGGYANNKIYYFIDLTELKHVADEFRLSHPCVMIIVIDNYEELIQNSKESEKSNLLGKFDGILEEYVGKSGGFMLKLKSDRFIAVVEDRDLEQMIGDKFSVLERAKSVVANNAVPLTISVGVGRSDNNLSVNEELARQGLDMALGRGGDQAVVRTPDAYTFYGGSSKGYERTTKVKSRMIAAAIKELVNESDNVIVMGHKYSDLDAVGSASALACAVRELGTNAVVAIDTEKTMASSLVEHIQKEIPGLYVHPSSAGSLVSQKTLLIIVDTHVPALLESEEIYKMCKTVAVIDHHRKNVKYISDAVIFYHEPYASSACEMVTEILQYWSGHPVIGKIQAEALLAGIMLDTKNFIYKTGVRTFEASAYLRRRGAETSDVRKLLASSLDTYQRKIKLVSSAATYGECAIAQSDFFSDDLRVVASQAADELLNISGIKASFVIYELDGVINISARSMGDINVQIIMEKLGGGGHLTMAAAQLENTDVITANNRLLEAIDEYNQK